MLKSEQYPRMLLRRAGSFRLGIEGLRGGEEPGTHYYAICAVGCDHLH
jgi:hypothetical protein